MDNIQSPPDNWSKLTAREIEIISAAAMGCSIKKTAVDLRISPNTVSNHRKKILRKLACGNITEAVSLASSAGILLQVDKKINTFVK